MYVTFDGGDTWSVTQKLVASDGAAGDYFGWALSVSDHVLAVGAYNEDPNGLSNAGIVLWFFMLSGFIAQTLQIYRVGVYLLLL